MFKKIALSGILCCGTILSGNMEIFVKSSKEDYKKYTTKINTVTNKLDLRETASDGVENTFGLNHTNDIGKIEINFKKLNINSEDTANPKTNEIEKYNASYKYFLTNSVELKGSYIKVIDDLSPTSQGRVYGLSGSYNIEKGLGVSLDIYNSYYNSFDVNQIDLKFFEDFKMSKLQGKATIVMKSIYVNGNKYPAGNGYAAYTFQNKVYNTTGIDVEGEYKGFFVGADALFGKRIFAVLEDGANVEHNTREEENFYRISFGKRFENLDITLQYSSQKGKDLLSTVFVKNQNDVEIKKTSLMLKYKF